MVFSGVFPLGTVDVRKTDIGYWVETLGGTMGMELDDQTTHLGTYQHKHHHHH